jgi:hypothetical protein
LHNGDVSPVTFPAYLATDVATRAVHRLAATTGVPADELVAAIRSGRLPTDPPTPAVTAARRRLQLLEHL